MKPIILIKCQDAAGNRLSININSIDAIGTDDRGIAIVQVRDQLYELREHHDDVIELIEDAIRRFGAL